MYVARRRDRDKKEAALSERLFAISLSLLCIGLEGDEINGSPLASHVLSGGHSPDAFRRETPFLDTLDFCDNV